MTAPAAYFEITKTLHTDCEECYAQAESAAIMARATGSTGGTQSVESWDEENGHNVVEHRATVRRIPGRTIILHGNDGTTAYEVAQDVTDRLGAALAPLKRAGGNHDALSALVDVAEDIVTDMVANHGAHSAIEV